jgi:hypothetical protein
VDEKPEPRWVRAGAWLISTLLFAFLAWFLLTLLFGGPGTCIWPGGC